MSITETDNGIHQDQGAVDRGAVVTSGRAVDPNAERASTRGIYRLPGEPDFVVGVGGVIPPDAVRVDSASLEDRVGRTDDEQGPEPPAGGEAGAGIATADLEALVERVGDLEDSLRQAHDRIDELETAASADKEGRRESAPAEDKAERGPAEVRTPKAPAKKAAARPPASN